jgi:hypothetical protein
VANIVDDTFKVTLDEELLEVGLTEEELLEAKMEVEVLYTFYNLREHINLMDSYLP